MKMTRAFCFMAVVSALSAAAHAAGNVIALSDGKTFRGWEGETNTTWRIQDEAFVGGSLEKKVPQNEFLATTRSFTNFVLRVEWKLTGTEGFINGGVQVRSERIQNPPNEMKGYQCDLGAGYWGCLYDESRRNKVLVAPDASAVKQALKPDEWNSYEIRCEGRRIRTSINGVPMIDYTETDASIPQFGKIGLQIHGGGKAQVAYRKITVEELP